MRSTSCFSVYELFRIRIRRRAGSVGSGTGVIFLVSDRPFYTGKLPCSGNSGDIRRVRLFCLIDIMILTTDFGGVRVVRQGALLGGFRQDSERFGSAETTALAFDLVGRITARFGRVLKE